MSGSTFVAYDLKEESKSGTLVPSTSDIKNPSSTTTWATCNFNWINWSMSKHIYLSPLVFQATKCQAGNRFFSCQLLPDVNWHKLSQLGCVKCHRALTTFTLLQRQLPQEASRTSVTISSGVKSYLKPLVCVYPGSFPDWYPWRRPQVRGFSVLVRPRTPQSQPMDR